MQAEFLLLPHGLQRRLHPEMQIRPLSVEDDLPLVHPWFGMDYARYWNMQTTSLPDAMRFYRALQASGHAQAYLGLHRGAPAFLLECYDPATEAVGRHYPVQPGDRGMHFFVGPARRPVRHFTLDVLRTVMDFMFRELGATRVVVEPDVRNDKVHRLNRAVGFVYDRQIPLPEKTAYLAFCRRCDFERSIQGEPSHAPSLR
ncbi:GNAT family N-acetyltransferase [Sphingomonas sp. NCPPB 2930]